MEQIYKGEISIVRDPEGKWHTSCILSGGDPYRLEDFGPSYAHPSVVDSWKGYIDIKNAIDFLCKWLEELNL